MWICNYAHFDCGGEVHGKILIFSVSSHGVKVNKMVLKYKVVNDMLVKKKLNE